MSTQIVFDFDAPVPPPAHFDGPAFDAALDGVRLTGQILRVYGAMKGGQWRTLAELEEITGDPQASISAQLRHLRKERFGAHEVTRRRRGEDSGGLWEYRLEVGE
jgi:hypothetical protein